MPSFPTSFLTSFGHALAVGVGALQGLRTAWQRRRILGQLAGLDDHMLRDIGVTRQDLLSVLAEPLYRDPTVCLALRADEARRARRALASASYALSRGAADPAYPDRTTTPERRAA